MVLNMAPSPCTGEQASIKTEHLGTCKGVFNLRAFSMLTPASPQVKKKARAGTPCRLHCLGSLGLRAFPPVLALRFLAPVCQHSPGAGLCQCLHRHAGMPGGAQGEGQGHLGGPEPGKATMAAVIRLPPQVCVLSPLEALCLHWWKFQPHLPWCERRLLGNSARPALSGGPDCDRLVPNDSAAF